MIKCLICGIEYSHERKICHNCESQAIISGLVQNESNNLDWTIDKFLAENNRVFKNVNSINLKNDSDFFSSHNLLIDPRKVNHFLIYE